LSRRHLGVNEQRWGDRRSGLEGPTPFGHGFDSGSLQPGVAASGCV